MTTAIYTGPAAEKAIAGTGSAGSRWRMMVLQVPLAGDAWDGHNVAGSAEARAAPVPCAWRTWPKAGIAAAARFSMPARYGQRAR